MANETLLVDTGGWYSLADRSDQYHQQAAFFYPEALKNRHHLTTTNLIIAETYILIHRSIGHQAAISFLANIAASPRIVKIYSDSSLENMAENILKQYQDQDFSYTDAVSFAVMQQYKIEQAFAFDRHFITAGFSLVP